MGYHNRSELGDGGQQFLLDVAVVHRPSLLKRGDGVCGVRAA
jgi:hypothetical protein